MNAFQKNLIDKISTDLKKVSNTTFSPEEIHKMWKEESNKAKDAPFDVVFSKVRDRLIKEKK